MAGIILGYHGDRINYMSMQSDYELAELFTRRDVIDEPANASETYAIRHVLKQWLTDHNEDEEFTTENMICSSGRNYIGILSLIPIEEIIDCLCDGEFERAEIAQNDGFTHVLMFEIMPMRQRYVCKHHITNWSQEDLEFLTKNYGGV